MKTRSLLAAVLFALAALPGCRDAGCNCAAPPSPIAGAPARHPLRGVVVDVLPARQALLVRHEAIPGFMAAMTMLFRVDAATLATAQEGRTLTGEIFQIEGEWWLDRTVFDPVP
jgi:protein SCO1/2